MNQSAPAFVEIPQSPRDPTLGPTIDWSDVVVKIKAGDPAGLAQLYKTSRGLRYFLSRQLGTQEVDDKIHDIFLLVVNAIQDGSLRQPERLMGFIRTIAQRQVAAQIKCFAKSRQREGEIQAGLEFEVREPNPEKLAMINESAGIVRQALAQLRGPEREILVRFYLREQSAEQICSEMNLSETQFRLHKSRAKTRFGEIGKKRMATAWYRRRRHETEFKAR